MLMNNLDPDVAERPEISWCTADRPGRAQLAGVRRHRPIAASLENDETLLVQSGKPVGIFRTHPWAPRVLIANAMLVPAWANWETFRDLETAA
jgi:urocanate hydratase